MKSLQAKTTNNRDHVRPTDFLSPIHNTFEFHIRSWRTFIMNSARGRGDTLNTLIPGWKMK